MSKPIPPPWHITALITERNTLKAKNAALQTTVDTHEAYIIVLMQEKLAHLLKIDTLELDAKDLTAEVERLNYRLSDSGRALFTASTELERLRDLIVRADAGRLNGSIIGTEARAILSTLAAREAGKA